ncbi:MAG: hypothetical protein R3331_07460 [Sulfurospirillaceae bacterium]|nr:hypothetical protein [Sulfurospirillaceae bacterium]
MAIGPIGATTYANQALPALASKQTNFQNRLDMQLTIAATALNNKEIEVAEVRPAEETHKIDPENQHQQAKSNQEEKENQEENGPKQFIEEEAEEQTPLSSHLDIKA